MEAVRVWKDAHDCDHDAGGRSRKLKTFASAEAGEYSREISNGVRLHTSKCPVWVLDTPSNTESGSEQVTYASHDVVRSHEHLNFSRVQDVNAQAVSKCTVKSVDFHSASELVCTGGLDNRVDIFRVNLDSNINEKLQSLWLGIPVVQAEFSKFRNSDRIVVCGKDTMFFGNLERNSLEQALMNGMRSGGTFVQSPDSQFIGVIGTSRLGLICQKSRSCVITLRSDSQIRTAAFDVNGNNILGCTEDGLLHSWDIRMRRCLNSASGFDAVKSICLSADGKKIITGAADGLVRVFSRESINWSSANCRNTEQYAIKTLTSLCTEITTLKASAANDLIAVASSYRRNSFRLIHLSSLTVINNWPTQSTPLHYVSSAAFNQAGTLLAIANARGHVLAYEISSKLVGSDKKSIGH